MQKVYNQLGQFSKPPHISAFRLKLKYTKLSDFNRDIVDDLIWNVGICPSCWMFEVNTKLIEYYNKYGKIKYNKICLICSFNTDMNNDSS